MLATRIGRLRPDDGYTRALAVDVLEAVPVWQLFGEHGQSVCALIGQAAQLNLTQAEQLSRARHPEAGRAYSAAWGNWLGRKGRSRSPVNCGFTILQQTIWKRAESLVGDLAFETDDDGEKCLALVWSAATDAMIEAAMALGAPDLLHDEGRSILSKAWHTVLGPNP